MIEMEMDSQPVSTALAQLAASMQKPAPVLRLIGERLAESSKDRFQNSTGPDGSRWQPNAVATLLGYAGKYAGSFRKDGRITSKGGNRIAGKKPLIGETRSLSGTITYRLVADGVEIGSPQAYAAIQQFGGKAGRGKKITIPARPFLGVSADDENRVVETVESYLRGCCR